MNNAFLYKLRYVTIISLKINLKVGEYMTIETNDNLNQLIKAYNHDIELNRLKDILDYLKSKPIYMPSTIKISKQKLLKIPNDDLIMILYNLSGETTQNYLPVYSSPVLFNSKYRYFVTLSIYDCFMLMKRFKEKNAIIINPNRDNSLVIDNILIKYLKNGG